MGLSVTDFSSVRTWSLRVFQIPEVLLFIQTIERDFSAGQSVFMQEKRRRSKSMSSFGANLRI